MKNNFFSRTLPALLFFCTVCFLAQAQTYDVEMMERGEPSSCKQNTANIFIQHATPADAYVVAALEHYADENGGSLSFLEHSEHVTAEITAVVKQFETEYNTADASSLHALFTTDAVLTGFESKKVVGSDAIGQWFTHFSQSDRENMIITVDEIIELPDGYAFCASAYANEQGQKGGSFSTLFKRENGVWKILRQTVAPSL